MSGMNLNSLNIGGYASGETKMPELMNKFPAKSRINTIKSKTTDQVFSVIPSDVNDETYSVYANDQCLWVYNDDYHLKPCANNIAGSFVHPQFFEAKNIIAKANERRYMGKTPITDHGLYPYTAFIHKTTQQCLTYDTDGLYVSKCDPDNIYQKWEVSPDKNMCLLE